MKNESCDEIVTQIVDFIGNKADKILEPLAVASALQPEDLERLAQLSKNGMTTLLRRMRKTNVKEDVVASFLISWGLVKLNLGGKPTRELAETERSALRDLLREPAKHLRTAVISLEYFEKELDS